MDPEELKALLASGQYYVSPEPPRFTLEDLKAALETPVSEDAPYMLDPSPIYGEDAFIVDPRMKDLEGDPRLLEMLKFLRGEM